MQTMTHAAPVTYAAPAPVTYGSPRSTITRAAVRAKATKGQLAVGWLSAMTQSTVDVDFITSAESAPANATRVASRNGLNQHDDQSK